ncbi:FMRFamide receptor [Lamellibrachia satsuma]|nr:FMRFamide receptor [Lamellibrachia satsuma]
MTTILASSMPNIMYDYASNGTLLSDGAVNCTRVPLTLDVYKIYKIVIDVFLVGFLCLVGFVGNALSIAVLYRDSDRNNTTNWLLQTLAVVDTMYLVASVFIQTIKTLHDHTDWVPKMHNVFVYMEPYVWAFASIVQTTTVWTVMLVTIDRYVAVCKPFQVQLRSLQRAKMAFLGIVVAAILYNIPRFFEREMRLVSDQCGDVVKTKKSAMGESWIYFLVYKTVLYFMFRAFGPLLTLIVLNTTLMRALHTVRKKREKLTRNSQHRENMTLVLVIVVSVFFVCQIPDLTLRIIMTFVNLHVIDVDLTSLRYVNAVTNMLLTINSSTNFLIYCLIGKKFRKILGQMCCPGLGLSASDGHFQMETKDDDTKTVRLIEQTNGKGDTRQMHVRLAQ